LVERSTDEKWDDSRRNPKGKTPLGEDFKTSQYFFETNKAF
jgi:hypothetical protein